MDTPTTTAITWTKTTHRTIGKVGRIRLFIIYWSALSSGGYQLKTTLPGLKTPATMETLEDCQAAAERMLAVFLRHLAEHGAKADS
jgi:hypothetical protein